MIERKDDHWWREKGRSRVFFHFHTAHAQQQQQAAASSQFCLHFLNYCLMLNVAPFTTFLFPSQVLRIDTRLTLLKVLM